MGSPITEDGNMNNVINMHIKSRISQINKFSIFCKKNDTMPFKFKKKVLDDVITSSLLYGCESWLTERTNKIEKLYSGAIKALLGVREVTRTDTVLIETGMKRGYANAVDENHIVFFCNKTNDLREKYGVNGELYQSMGKLLDQHPLKELVDFIDSCSSRF